MAWHASTPHGGIDWTGTLEGDPAAVERVREALLRPGDLALTPTGPYPARDERDELAILGALFELYGDEVELSGETPDLDFGAPPDAIF